MICVNFNEGRRARNLESVVGATVMDYKLWEIAYINAACAILKKNLCSDKSFLTEMVSSLLSREDKLQGKE